METIIAGIITAFILFICGSFFKKPIVELINNSMLKISIILKKEIKVRVFFICCPFCKDELKILLLNQNNIQSIFQFEIPDWSAWHAHSTVEYNLSNFKTESKVSFCNEFQKELNKYYNDMNIDSNKCVNIVITEIPFPQNFYTWNTKDRRTIVIGIKSLANIFKDSERSVNLMILRVVQRMAVYSQNIKNLAVHPETKGCLFDFTRELKHLSFSAEKVGLCPECRDKIINSMGAKYYKRLAKWLGIAFEK